MYAKSLRKKRKHGELAPKDGRLRISQLTLATLLVNFIQAARSGEVGYENTKRTLQEFLSEIERMPKVPISVGDLEDMLCAVNLRSEQGAFWSPKEGETFSKHLRNLFWYARLDYERLTFDKDYNTIGYYNPPEDEKDLAEDGKPDDEERWKADDKSV